MADRHRTSLLLFPATLALALPCAPAFAADQPRPWAAAEAPILSGHLQLTFPEQFVRAGEAYFNPDASWIIFQAVPVPPAGESPSPHYSMYVAPLARSEAGAVSGLGEPILVSPEGSANTCGFFNPITPWRIIFGSTLVPPTDRGRSGYQRGASRYIWQFPPEMDVCTRVVTQVFYSMQPPDAQTEVGWGADARAPLPLWTRPGYDAECAYSPNGRFIVFTAMDEEAAEGPDADIHVFDAKTQQTRPLVVAKGYDGGPFFSPDGRRICYRSDRRANDLLQVFVADLEFDDAGAPVSVAREHQLTSDEHVNWAPFWHPSGEFLVFTTSRLGHQNYEVFAIEAPAIGPAAADFAPASHRITGAQGFDGLPAFSADGSLLMWTSQRDAPAEPGQRPGAQVWIAEFDPSALKLR